ncbi:hypothetical protein llap_9822 [Limosa lapponica baueri]|uniref:Uncharacterized protein n=1 Tax=Limosa lapponica baueri TaxID=1758121 RepID=A0A2I0U1H6_LIMLA|nr:hypothetical protein llap_9822 [Limosa lapponica baueri]
MVELSFLLLAGWLAAPSPEPAAEPKDQEESVAVARNCHCSKAGRSGAALAKAACSSPCSRRVSQVRLTLCHVLYCGLLQLSTEHLLEEALQKQGEQRPSGSPGLQEGREKGLSEAV